MSRKVRDILEALTSLLAFASCMIFLFGLAGSGGPKTISDEIIGIILFFILIYSGGRFLAIVAFWDHDQGNDRKD